MAGPTQETRHSPGPPEGGGPAPHGAPPEVAAGASRAAGLAGLLAVAAVLLGLVLVRIRNDDVVWHLATARWALQHGAWPVTNTFSWTFPDHPLYQQYPVFQAVLAAVFGAAGWSGLSWLSAGLWLGALMLAVAWAGGRPAVASLGRVLWWLVVVLALSRRPLLRPDVLSVAILLAMLAVADRMADGRRRWWLALPVLQWLWANSHQLFVAGLAVQVGFLVVARWAGGAARGQATSAPAWVLGLLASALACLATPLGFDVVAVFRHTTGSLAAHGTEVREFAPIWTQPIDGVLALAIVVPAGWAWARAGLRAGLRDGVALAMVTAMTALASRGLPFLALVGGAVFVRGLDRRPLVWAWSEPTPRRVVRAAGALAAAVLALGSLTLRWSAPDEVGLVQAGIGRTRGDWPLGAMDFLGRARPPGQMMNLPWSAAASLWFRPEIPVFVDPRFETYPRPFLLEAAEARTSDAVLRGLVARYQPGFVLAEHCYPGMQARVRGLVGAGFEAVYADARTIVLVADRPESRAYRDQHRLGPWPKAAPVPDGPRPATPFEEQCWQGLRAVMTEAGTAGPAAAPSP